MEWVERMNKALDYLEEHLAGEVELEEAARLACCSPYHFQRIFPYLAGVPLSEYLRRRRMSLAAADLLAGEKVVEVALRYGYNSPTAFNRACQGERSDRNGRPHRDQTVLPGDGHRRPHE